MSLGDWRAVAEMRLQAAKMMCCGLAELIAVQSFDKMNKWLSGDGMPVQLNPIEAHERTVYEIFSDTYAFEIPPYQRPYAWEEEHTRQLLTDLLEAMDNTETSDEVYFLGSIVLIKSPSDPQARVVDGQQRLTTLTILLSVLRDLTTNTEVRFSRRGYVFQKANPDSGARDRFRLLLRQSDRAFFQKFVQNPDATNNLPELQTLEGSQKHIAENARYLRAQLDALNEDRRNALVAFIIQRCYVVVVAVPTADAARRIFTVLNARGLDLTATDILKADLLERAGAAREADLANRWEAVEQALGRDEMVELFGHVRMIYERDKPRIALETGFPKVVTPFMGDADNFISNILEPLSDALLLLAEPNEISQQFGSAAAKAVRSLGRIDNKDWVPPALLRLWKRSPEDNTTVANFLIELERLAYFLFVTRADVNDRIQRFSAVMDAIDPRDGKAVPVNGLSLSDVEQNDFLATLSGALYLKTRVCKPVLQRLDEALSSGGASYDELVSIEHVLPQTVDDGSEWAKLFPDKFVRQEWMHRLANLVFLTRRINTRASNWDFHKKKITYFASKDGTSPFPITQEVVQADKWDVSFLEKRQNHLIGKLSEVWRLRATESAAHTAVAAIVSRMIQESRPPA
jgi:hypothetical protein